MNLSVSFKILNILWWIFTPVAFMLLADASFAYIYKKPEISVKKQKVKPVPTVKHIPLFIVRSKKINTRPEKEKSSIVLSLGDIKLKGCYVDEASSFVILEHNLKTIFLDINSTYQDIKLIKVSDDYAILLKNGKRIKLTINKQNSKDKDFTILKSKILAEDAEQKYIHIYRKDFQKYKNNIDNIKKDIRIESYKDKDGFLDIRIIFVRPGTLFEKMGLKDKETIVAINSRKLKSLKDLFFYYKRVDEMSTFVLTVKKGKNIKDITYEID